MGHESVASDGTGRPSAPDRALAVEGVVHGVLSMVPLMSSINPPLVDEDSVLGLTSALAEAAQILFADGGVDETLGAVVALAVATIEDCDVAGVFLIDGDVVTTRAHTSALVAAVDALQHSSGEGPCLDAVAMGAPSYANDLSEEQRWPTFSPLAVAFGIRSVFAVPLWAEGAPVGGLNLYARLPGAFGVIDRARGVLLAALASLAVATAQSHEDDERRTANLEAALVTREIIGQAQGILMERERITADQAFDVLRRASQHLNRKLREIAETLVDTGEGPDVGPRPASNR